MQSQTRESVSSGVRFLAREVLREPVREAVREALREEALSVQSASGGRGRSDAGGRTSADREWSDREWSDRDRDSDISTDSSGGRSKLAMVLGLVALVGLTMLVRRKRGSSEQSDLSSFDEGTGGEFGAGAGGTGGGRSTTSGGVEADERGASSTPPTE